MLGWYGLLGLVLAAAMRYPDGYAAYVVGATFETTDVAGTVSSDDAGETAALAWYPAEDLPADIFTIASSCAVQASTSDTAKLSH